jgi:hypothetical protein
MTLCDCHDAKPGGSKQSIKSWTYLEIPLLPEKEERRDTDRLNSLETFWRIRHAWSGLVLWGRRGS